MFFNTHLFTNLGMFQTDDKGQKNLEKMWKDFVKYDYLGEKNNEIVITKEEINKRIERATSILKKE